MRCFLNIVLLVLISLPLRADDARIDSLEKLVLEMEQEGIAELAFSNAELLRSLKDSILNTKNSKLLKEMESRFETEKKEQEISLLQKDNSIKDLRSNMTRDELLRKNTLKYGSYAAVALLLVMILFILKSSADQKKANALLDSRNKELELQKNIIEQKNSLINDSIEYASIIQQTLFPSGEQLSTEFGKVRLQQKNNSGIGNYSYALEKFGSTSVFFFIQSRFHGVSGSLHSLRIFHELRNLCARKQQFEPAIVARFIEASAGKDLQLLTAFRTEHNKELHLVGSSELLVGSQPFGKLTMTAAQSGPKALSLDGNTPFLVESREAGVQIHFG